MSNYEKNHMGWFGLSPDESIKDSHEFPKKTLKYVIYALILVCGLDAISTIPEIDTACLILPMVLSPLALACLADKQITK